MTVDTSSTIHASSDLTRLVGGVELPAAGLWNIPSGHARIDLSVPRLLGAAFRARMRLKQGMIAIADDPMRSTANLSLDAASVRTGNAFIDNYLHDQVFDTGKYSTVPVRFASVEHCGDRTWTAQGWLTIRGTAIPIELTINYVGISGGVPVALFRAHATLPLRSVLPVNSGVRGRFLAGRDLRIAIEVRAEPVRAMAEEHTSRIVQQWRPAALARSSR